MKHRHRPTGPVPDAREALAVRSGGRCEMALLCCTGRATEAAHRIGKKAGGRKGAALAESNRLSNVVHACHECHMWTHDHPSEARDMGLMLREGDSSEVAPLQYRNEGMVRLTDDGAREAAT